MGQYFKAVNLDKREVVCPWCVGGPGKLWEWAVDPQGSIVTLLIRQSNRTGVGDVHGPSPLRVPVNITATQLAEAKRKHSRLEKRLLTIPPNSIVGRWAGDRVTLVGDYDESTLYDELDSYTNISRQVVQEWNEFIDTKQLRLVFKHCGCASPLLKHDSQS